MKPYLKNLDGLRFIAALMVLLQHCVLFLKEYNGTTSFFYEKFRYLGGFGVGLFFVLSGFLITYLMLKEIEKTGRLSIKDFIMRRILRIWPLYFAWGLLGTVLAPFVLQIFGVAEINTNDIGQNLLCLLFFGINLQLIFMPYNRGIMEILWSVCIEEHFYLLWPWCWRQLWRNFWVLMAVIIGIGFASRLVMIWGEEHRAWNMASYYFTLCRFDMFAYGAIAAYALHKRAQIPKIFNFLQQKPLQIAVITTIALYAAAVFGVDNIFYNNVWLNCFSGILFAYLILTATLENSILSLENRQLNELGKISYGIYVMHPIFCHIALRLVGKVAAFLPFPVLLFNFAFPLLALVMSVLAAFISYYYFESYFLRLKEKFSRLV